MSVLWIIGISCGVAGFFLGIAVTVYLIQWSMGADASNPPGPKF